MFRTVEAVIDKRGRVRLLEPVELEGEHRALVTILNEEPAVHGNESALLSEAALAGDWNRSEEDTAWSHLQASAVVLAPFPFSDLSRSKLRSVVVLTDAVRGN
jgi:hypothetical protein